MELQGTEESKAALALLEVGSILKYEQKAFCRGSCLPITSSNSALLHPSLQESVKAGTQQPTKL